MNNFTVDRQASGGEHQLQNDDLTWTANPEARQRAYEYILTIVVMEAKLKDKAADPNSRPELNDQEFDKLLHGSRHD